MTAGLVLTNTKYLKTLNTALFPQNLIIYKNFIINW